MAINLCNKFAPHLDKRFSVASKTNEGAGHEFDFVGVNAINILTADLVQTANYTRSGSTRFGTLNELGDTKQTLTMAVDKCFSFSIDAGNAAEQFNLKQAAKQMKVQWDEVVTPEIDAYRLNAWATGHGLSSGFAVQSNTGSEAALAKNTIIEKIFEASAALSDEKVPANNRTLYISELDFVKFKLSDVVIGGNQLNGEAVERGYKGKIDGISVVTVPSTYMPTKVGFILKYKDSTVDPLKLKNLRVHKNPMGVDGDVVECRYMYDSFVLDQRAKGIYVWKTSA